VRSISASVMRRRRAKSARPTAGCLGLRGRFGIVSILAALTASGGDDSANNLAVCVEAIGVDDGQTHPVCPANRDPSDLAVVPPCVRALQRRRREDRGRESEVEASKREVALTLARIPRETHDVICVRIYTGARALLGGLASRLTDSVQLRRIQ